MGADSEPSLGRAFVSLCTDMKAVEKPTAGDHNCWRKAVLQTISLGIACASLLSCSQSPKTYTQEVDEFEARVRKEVDPSVLQTWAVGVISDYAKAMPASEETVTYEVKDVPESIRKLDTRLPAIFAFINRRDEYSYVAIRWGSGFRGHWGLSVGSTNFLDYSGQRSEMWKPGVYFWRSYRAEKSAH